jgi:hypothetical protein
MSSTKIQTQKGRQAEQIVKKIRSGTKAGENNDMQLADEFDYSIQAALNSGRRPRPLDDASGAMSVDAYLTTDLSERPAEDLEILFAADDADAYYDAANVYADVYQVE